MKRSALAPAVLVLLLLAGCAVDGRVAAAGVEPRADPGRRAVLAASDPPSEGAASAGGKQASSLSPGLPSGPPPGEELATVEDESGDHGDGPRYADLVDVTFIDSEEGLAVSVALGAMVRRRLDRGEIQNVGVDVYRVSPLEALLGQTESDFQVRLDGGVDGWRAFLRVRDGYVAFPGSFTVTGRTLHVVLPWEAVGGRERAVADVFVDWSSGVGRLSTDGVPRVRLQPE